MMNTPTNPNPAMEELPKGTLVYDTFGDKVGHVSLSTLRDGYFVVEQGWLFTHELFVPRTAIQTREANWVKLRLAKDELKQDQYKQPPAARVNDEAAAPPIVPPVTPAPGPIINAGEVIEMPPPEEEPPLANR